LTPPEELEFSPMAIGGGCRRGITRFFLAGSRGGLTDPL